MAEEAVVEPQTGQPPRVDPEIQAEARRGGWRPKEEWRGRPEEWVDEKTFVENGRRVLPHVQRHAARLEQENAALKAQQATLAAELETMKGQVSGLTQFQADMAVQTRERLRREWAAELHAAREAGDTAKEIEILGRASAPPPTAPPRTAQPAPAPAPAQRTEIPQELRDWTAANPWYGQDPVITQAMQTVGAEMRLAGQLTGMSLTDQLNATAKVVQKRYMPAPVMPATVEGGSPSRDGGPQVPAQNTWESLPAHIKQACDAQGERLGLIGDRKAFKTKEEHRAAYVKQYYAHESAYDFRPPGN